MKPNCKRDMDVLEQALYYQEQGYNVALEGMGNRYDNVVAFVLGKQGGFVKLIE